MKVSGLFIFVLGGVFAVGLFVLGVALFRVQVMDVGSFRRDLQTQMTRRIFVPGRRGRILDRTGKVLADDRTSHNIVCHIENFQRSGGWSNTVNAAFAQIDAAAAKLGLERTVTYSDVARHVKLSLFVPMTVWCDVSDATMAYFAEHASEFPGFGIAVDAVRTYPNGRLAAHVIGYTGTEKRPEHDAGGARIHHYAKGLKGRSGLESYYDRFLTGVAGEADVRVNARGFSTGTARERVPETGLDLCLTLDIGIQRALERALAGETGAGVVLDADSGAVLAMASAPDFDPNEFVPRITSARYMELAGDASHPLLNRAISGAYAPGSIFKPITALAGLNAEIDPEETYNCTGAYRMGELALHCWNRYGHGHISMHSAMVHSCNPYFCDLGMRVGTNGLTSAARAFGLGSRTDIDLGGEAAGRVPDETWKRKAYGEPWFAGDLAQMSMGQGMLLVTPLQMAVACAAFANGGKLVNPHLHAGWDAPPERTIPFRAEHIEQVRVAMRDVAVSGTGKRILMREEGEGASRRRYRLNVSCAGKTGTAQMGAGANRWKNAWVIAFAPYEQPKVAIALLVEHGESGGATAAPRVHEVLAHIFGEHVEGGT